MSNNISKNLSVFLDLIRACSAQLVLIGHLFSFWGWQDKFKIPMIQNFGVMIFFLLSGFLISFTCLKNGKEYGFKNYFIDRFSRIYYSFIPAIIFVFICDLIILLFGKYNELFNNSYLNFFGNLLMLQSHKLNYLGFEAFGSARPFWSVSLEWWIYLIFGVIFYLNRQQFKNKFWLIFASFVVFIGVPLVFSNAYNRDFLILFHWLVGMSFAFLIFKFNIVNKIKYCFILILVFFMFILIFTPNNKFMYGTLIISTMILCFQIYKLNIKNQYFAYISSFANFIASYSFSMYLIHYTLIELFLTFFSIKSLSNFIIIWILINVCSYFFYLLFEKDNLKLRLYLKK